MKRLKGEREQAAGDLEPGGCLQHPGMVVFQKSFLPLQIFHFGLDGVFHSITVQELPTITVSPQVVINST